MDRTFEWLSSHLPTRRKPQLPAMPRARGMKLRRCCGAAVKLGHEVFAGSACSSSEAPGKILRVDSITKQYVDQRVLADVSFDILAGEIIGTIGPNGAGKTTLLEAVAGILPIDKGDICWRGKPLPTSRRREAIFYLPDGVRPYQDQPVTRVLTFFADVYRRSTNEIRSVGLTPVLRKRVYSLSKGYGRRLMLALKRTATCTSRTIRCLWPIN